MTIVVAASTTPPGTIEPGVFAVDATATDATGAPIKYALIDYRTVGDLDWRMDAPGRRIDGVGPYHWALDASLWPDGSQWEIAVTAFSTVAGVPSGRKKIAVTVQAPPPPPIAAFTVTPGNATVMKLASVSTGDTLTYAWEVDGAAAGSDPAVEVARPVGFHTVRLTVTDAEGRTSVVEQTAAWTWDVLRWTAQKDVANGMPGGGASLPPLTEFIEPYAAFRTFECINTRARDGSPDLYSVRPQPDGSCEFEVHQSPDPATIPYWDHPGTTGGDRAGMGWNHADANGKTNVMGDAPLEVRFIRHEVTMLAATWLNADGSPVSMRGVHNNDGELHGAAGGPSTVTWGYGDSDNKTYGIVLSPNPGPTPAGYTALKLVKCGIRPVAPGTPHRLILELLPGTLEQGGYIRVFRYLPDDPTADQYGYVCVSRGINSWRRTADGVWYVQDVPDDGSGKVYGPIVKYVKQADGTFAPEPMNVAFQHYRQRTQSYADGPNPLPDSSVRFAAPRIGPTYESVM